MDPNRTVAAYGTTQEFFDTKTLANGTLAYNYFPATPTSGVASNYLKMPFQQSKVTIKGIKASTSQSKFTYAQWIEYQDALVEAKLDSYIIFRTSLHTLLGWDGVAANTPASGASTEFVALNGERYLKLETPIDVNNTQSLFVTVTFLACTQTTNMKIHLYCNVMDNLQKQAL